VDTRLRKLEAGEYDAVVLAEAGLRRLGLADRITQILPFEIVLPAAGQGALAIEARADDEAARRFVSPLDHPLTRAAVLAERALIAALGAGCTAPVAALGRVEGERLTLSGRVLSPDGVELREAARSASLVEALVLGRQVAEELTNGGRVKEEGGEASGQWPVASGQ
jgi:hydroxymethylbilane synthase